MNTTSSVPEFKGSTAILKSRLSAYYHSVKMPPFPWSIDATGTQDAGLQPPSTFTDKKKQGSPFF